MKRFKDQTETRWRCNIHRPACHRSGSSFISGVIVIFLLLNGWFIACPPTASSSTPSFTIGQIDDTITVGEGDLLNFTVRPPTDFGPDVRWRVSSPDLSDEELRNIFFDVPAFPGAEGFGAGTRGGRGGQVIKVTNLNTSGPGSFAAALLAEGPRIIVFDVSGVIEGPPPPGAWLIPKSKRFYATNAPVTIAGQTAPGAGITLSGQLVFREGDGGTPVDNVTARFLRIRDPYHRTGVGDNLDAPGNMGVFDHLSGAWGVDENFDFSGLKNGSIQWCGVEEAAGYGHEWEVHIDKDNDGMLDYWEKMVCDFKDSDDVKDYILHVNPDDDLDGDGATNIQEYRAGSNPLAAGVTPDPAWTPGYDSDRDGMFDWWELKVIASSDTDALNTLADVRPGDDLDGDLATNREEHDAGTTPLQGPTHNYGMIMGYSGKNISLHHNFFAHHHTRSPLSGVEVMDHRNNVIYNIAEGIVWHPPTMNEQRPGELFKANVVNNFFKVGPNSRKLDDGPWEYPFINGASARIFGIGNYFDMTDTPTGHLDIFDPGRLRIASLNAENRGDTAYPAPPVTTGSAEAAYEAVLAHAGCLPWDAVTRRNVAEIKTRTGKWGKAFPEGGLMAGLTPGSALPDSDGDGMPDQWETATIRVNAKSVNRGAILNPAAQDHNRIVKAGESVLTFNGQPVPGTEDRYKGYTYIEYYINELADRHILEALLAAGLDRTALPGYGQTVAPTFSWVPDYGQNGAYDIVVTADDGTRTLSQTIRIRVTDTNRNPYVYAAMYKADGTSMNLHQVQTIEPGKGLAFDFYVQDIDGDPVTVEIDNMPDGAVVTDTGMTTDSLKGNGTYRIYSFQWDPTMDDIGWNRTLSIVAMDGSGGRHEQTVTIAVAEPDRPVHTISVETGDGGRTSLGTGDILFQEGEDAQILIYAQDGHRLADLIVDGRSVGAVGEYVFTNISSDHAVQAHFDDAPGAIGGCILDMRFEGDMRDASIYGNHGATETGRQPLPTTDRFGRPNGAYEFDGADDFIRIADSDVFDGPAYTVTAWVYPRKDLYSGQYILSKNAKDGHDHIGLYTVYDSIYTCGANYPHSNAVLKDRENRWMHLAVVRAATGIATFYLNGEFAGQGSTHPNTANSLDLIIGAKNAETTFFQGIIDDLQIYNQVLSPSQVLRRYTETKPDGHYDPPEILIKAPGGLKIIEVK